MSNIVVEKGDQGEQVSSARAAMMMRSRGATIWVGHCALCVGIGINLEKVQ